jgi:hypothetical protein
MDDAGNAMATWSQWDGGQYIVWANRFVRGVGWGTPVRLANGAGSAVIGFDAAGNAIAVWGAAGTLWANRFVPATGWGTATLITNGPSQQDPDLAVEPGGNAMAVWRSNNTSTVGTWASRFVVGTGWSARVRISDAFNTQIPQVAVSRNGDALAVWERHDVFDMSVMASRFSLATGWGTPTFLENDTRNALRPNVAMDDSGNGMAVWAQASGGGIQANRYVAGVGWDPPVSIQVPGSSGLDTDVAMDPNGNAVAVWEQWDSGAPGLVWANRFMAGTGWGTAVAIESFAGDGYIPQVAIDACGRATAVWSQLSDTGSADDVGANRFE